MVITLVFGPLSPAISVYASEIAATRDASEGAQHGGEESNSGDQSSNDEVAAPDSGDSLSPADTTGTVIAAPESDTTKISTNNRGSRSGSRSSSKKATRTEQIAAPVMMMSLANFESKMTYGDIINTVQINDTTQNGPTLSENDSYARSIANIGDFNGDGVNDIASGAYNGGANNRGELHISFLDTDGSVKDTVLIGQGYGNGPTLADADHYGSAVAPLGDLNGDGVIDLAVGAYYDDTSGPGQGAIYIQFMNADGSVKTLKKINGHTPNGPALNNEDHYGGAIANIGDLNGDGYTDIAVAAHYSDTNGENRGAVFVHFLKNTGEILSTKILNDATVADLNLENNDNFGVSVTGMGDMNEDGILDIAVGSYSNDPSSPNNSGAVSILYMKQNGTVDYVFEVNEASLNAPDLMEADYFGRSVANAGDINKDGFNDLIVGANYDDTTGTNKGAVYLVYMWGQSVRAFVKIDDTTANGPELLNDDGRYGMSVANMGDINNDGVLDIAVGERLSDAGGVDQGALHIHFLDEAPNLIGENMFVYSTAEINDATQNGPVLADEDFYGVGADNIGDINGDGINDIAVGANYADHAAINDGAVFISFLNAEGGVISTKEIGSSVENGPVDYGDSANYGIEVASIGDWNNDGTPDIAVGQRYADIGGTNRGAIYLHFLTPEATIKGTIQLSAQTPNGATYTAGDHYGNGIALIHDLDGDGVNEIAVAADNSDVVFKETGKVFIHFMKASGEIKFTKVLSKQTPNGANGIQEGDRFGSEIEDIGDLDGDGVHDIAVSVPYHDTNVQSTGAIYVHFMTAQGDVKDARRISNTLANGPLLSWEDFFGVGFDVIGDLDGDGITELAVGANYDDAGGANKGAVHIVFLNNDATIKNVLEINDLTPNGPVISNSGARYGSEVMNMGDMNGDGYTDIAVSEYKNDTNGFDRGAIHIHYLGPVDGVSNVGFNVNPDSVNVSDVNPTANGNVVLTSAPNSNVVFSITSSNTNLVTVAPAELTFTNSNWNVAQNIVITKTGNDVLVPTIVEVTISVVDDLSDDEFDSLADKKIFVTVLPDENSGGGDDAGFNIAPSSLTIAENGGTDTFAVVLTKEPTSNVVVNVVSQDTSDVTVNPATLTFTTANWNVAQVVTATGVNDSQDSNDTATIVVSISDADSADEYDVLADKSVSVTLTDDDENSSNGGGGGGSSGSKKYACHDQNAVNYNPKYTHKQSLCVYGQVLGAATEPLSCSSELFLTRPIKFGAKNNVNDVMLLEKYLNTYENANIPVDGIYSQEDFNLVVKWQEKWGEDILGPWGITKGTGYVFMTSLAKIRKDHTAACNTVAPVQILSCAEPLQYPVEPILGGQVNDTYNVMLLERFLNTYEGAALPVDGLYAENDFKAVLDWQTKYKKDVLEPAGLNEASGIIGQISLEKIKQIHVSRCALFVTPPQQ